MNSPAPPRPPTHATLLAAGSEYLRYERGCPLLSWQRGPWPKIRPDLLGVTPARKTIEVEIKRSLFDFRANAGKRGQRQRERGRHCPHQFYFLVPPHLVARVRPELPAGAGLLTVGPERRISGTPRVVLVAPAAIHRRARRLDLREMVLLVRHQSGTLCSAAARLARREESRPPPVPDPARARPRKPRGTKAG